MKIGIIGSGNIGGALVRQFRAAGHEVSIANSRGPASLVGIARETGAHAASVDDAARGNDLVVVAIPLAGVTKLPAGLFADAAPNLIVVDACNYYPRQRDGRIADIEAGLTESGWVEQQLGHPVIKTFNMISAQHLLEDGKPAGASDRIAVAVAGDDPGAKAMVMDLVNEIGFDAVDAGTIDDSWHQQPGSPATAQAYDVQGLHQALSQARKERAPEWQATRNSPGTAAIPA